MSGLLDRIVRHRRATASRRLGPATKHAPAKPAWTPPAAAPAPPPTPAPNRAERWHPAPRDRDAAAPPAVEQPTDRDERELIPPIGDEPEPVMDPPAAPAEDPWPEEPPAPVEETAAPAEEPAPRRTVTLPSRRPAPAPATPQPRRARGSARRRLRYLRSLREVMLRDLGGFLLELHRFDIERPELVRAKLIEAARLDAELRVLERALGHEEALREIREVGLGGACANCGAVHGSTDRFCASCGESLGAAGARYPAAEDAAGR